MNLRPALPGGKQVISKVPRMKRESPVMHVEKAKAGIKVQQESDRSVLDRMKRDANFHIEYFYPGVDDSRKMEVPMKDLAASIEPADPEHPDAPREGTYAKHSRQIDVREDANELARDTANADARNDTKIEEMRERIAGANENARLERAAHKKAEKAYHDDRQEKVKSAKVRARIAIDVEKSRREPKEEVTHMKPPETRAEYRDPKYQRFIAKKAAEQMQRRADEENIHPNDPRLKEATKRAAALVRGKPFTAARPLVTVKPEPQPSTPVQTYILERMGQVDTNGFWAPEGLGVKQRKSALSSVIGAMKAELHNRRTANPRGILTEKQAVGAYRRANRDEVKPTGGLTNEHMFRALHAALHPTVPMHEHFTPGHLHPQTPATPKRGQSLHF